MIKALPKLPKATAIIAGATKQKDLSFKRKLETRIKQTGLTKRIIFLGEVPSQELPALLQGCRVLMALPRYEGFGLTPLEGMACGLPVIASNTGYFKEFLNAQDEDNACGNIVPLEDYKQASKEVVNLLLDKERFDRFSQSALLQVTKNYSALEEAKAINRVYEKLWGQDYT